MVFRQLRKLAVDKKTVNDLADKKDLYTIDIHLEHKKELEKRATTSTESQSDATDPALAVKQAKAAFEQDRNRRAYKMWYEGDLTLNEISTSFNLGSADAMSVENIVYPCYRRVADFALQTVHFGRSGC